MEKIHPPLLYRYSHAWARVLDDADRVIRPETWHGFRMIKPKRYLGDLRTCAKAREYAKKKLSTIDGWLDELDHAMASESFIEFTEKAWDDPIGQMMKLADAMFLCSDSAPRHWPARRGIPTRLKAVGYYPLFSGQPKTWIVMSEDRIVFKVQAIEHRISVLKIDFSKIDFSKLTEGLELRTSISEENPEATKSDMLKMLDFSKSHHAVFSMSCPAKTMDRLDDELMKQITSLVIDWTDAEAWSIPPMVKKT